MQVEHVKGRESYCGIDRKVRGVGIKTKHILVGSRPNLCDLQLKSICFPTNALRGVIYKTHAKTPTCFRIPVPSSGSYYNKGVRANLLIYNKLASCLISQQFAS